MMILIDYLLILRRSDNCKVKHLILTYAASMSSPDSWQSPVPRFASVAFEPAHARPTRALPILVTAVRHRPEPIATASRTRDRTTLLVRPRRNRRPVSTTPIHTLRTMLHSLFLHLPRVICTNHNTEMKLPQ